jgi:hypothetical protein
MATTKNVQVQKTATAQQVKTLQAAADRIGVTVDGRVRLTADSPSAGHVPLPRRPYPSFGPEPRTKGLFATWQMSCVAAREPRMPGYPTPKCLNSKPSNSPCGSRSRGRAMTAVA